MRKNRLIPVLFLLAIIMGLILIFLIPPFQTPDEFDHYDYAVYLSKVNVVDFLFGAYEITAAEQSKVVTKEVSYLLDISKFHGIPFNYEKKVKVSLWETIQQAQGREDLDTENSLSQEKLLGGAYNYPPFYYWFLSLFLRLIDVFHINIVIKFLLARLTSLGLFLASLYLALKTLRLIPLGEKVITVIFAIVALQPQLGMISVSIQPDILVLFLITGCFYFILRFIKHDSLQALYLFSLFSGLLWLTKAHFFLTTYFPLIILLVAILFIRKTLTKKISFHILTSGIMVFLLGGWWYIRSFLLFKNPIGYISFETASSPFLENIGNWLFFWMPPIFKRFWGVWGWVDYSYPLFVYGGFLLLCLIPFPFWVIRLHSFFKGKKETIDSFRASIGNQLLNILVITVPLVTFSLVMFLIAGIKSPLDVNQGRHWLPLILPIAVYLGGFLEFIFVQKGEAVKKIKLQTVMYAYIVVFFTMKLWMILLTYKRYY